MTDADLIVIGHCCRRADLGLLCAGRMPGQLADCAVLAAGPGHRARRVRQVPARRPGGELGVPVFGKPARLPDRADMPADQRLGWKPGQAGVRSCLGASSACLMWLAPLAALRVFYELTYSYVAARAAGRR